MGEDISDTNSSRKKNMRVFRNGALLAVLVSLLLTCAAIDIFINRSPRWGGVLGRFVGDSAPGGMLNIYVAELLIYVGFIFGVLFIQLVIYVFFRYLNGRNIEISDAKKTIFYVIELFVAFMPFVLIRSLTL